MCINIWKLFEDSYNILTGNEDNKNAFGFELQTKNLPRELAEMKVVNGDDASVSEMVHHLPNNLFMFQVSLHRGMIKIHLATNLL